eukprot:3438608-Prymnesium_polylepis.1
MCDFCFSGRQFLIRNRAVSHATRWASRCARATCRHFARAARAPGEHGAERVVRCDVCLLEPGNMCRDRRCLVAFGLVALQQKLAVASL